MTKRVSLFADDINEVSTLTPSQKRRIAGQMREKPGVIRSIEQITRDFPDLRPLRTRDIVHLAFYDEVGVLAAPGKMPRGAQSRLAERYGLRRRYVYIIVGKAVAFVKEADRRHQELVNDPEFRRKSRERFEKRRGLVDSKPVT